MWFDPRSCLYLFSRREKNYCFLTEHAIKNPAFLPASGGEKSAVKMHNIARRMRGKRWRNTVGA